MGKLIADPSATSQQATFADLLNATSSPASADGRSPSDSQTGQTTGRSGPRRSHASRGADAASSVAPLTNGISGQSSSSASASAALSASLASKLKERLASVGLMEYKQTWKQKVTPAGRLYWAHTASARRTGDSASSGWPTPNLPTGGANSKRQERNSGGPDLEEVAAWATPNAMDSTRGTPETDADKKARGANPGQSLLDQAAMAGWATPRQTDGKCGGNYTEKCTGKDLTKDASMVVGWPTASSRDWKDTPGMATTGINPDGSERNRTDMLPRVAALWGWTTPQAHDVTARGANQKAKHGTKHGCADLNADASQVSGYATPRAEDAESSGMRHSRNVADTLSAIAGQDLNCCVSGTEKRGVLNPALSRWLQGYPVAWCQAAIRAWRTLKRLPKRARCASKATATPSCPKSPPSL